MRGFVCNNVFIFLSHKQAVHLKFIPPPPSNFDLGSPPNIYYAPRESSTLGPLPYLRCPVKPLSWAPCQTFTLGPPLILYLGLPSTFYHGSSFNLHLGSPATPLPLAPVNSTFTLGPQQNLYLGLPSYLNLWPPSNLYL